MMNTYTTGQVIDSPRERPILFGTDMVRAILEDRKTHTRRIIKLPKWSMGNWEDFESDGKTATIICQNTGCQADIKPLYKVGDILWVRETWCELPKHSYHYKANYGTEKDQIFYQSVVDPKWHPSIHMPREAARLFLRVTNIRVERLQDISSNDAKNEGIRDYAVQKNLACYWVTAYSRLWDEIYKKQGCGWDKNPWVWVIEFERVEA
jgi:hypothetical protein